MSALADFAAALLPPEAGGPEPERVAGLTRALIDRMPAVAKAGIGAGLVGVECASLVRLRTPLGSAAAHARAELLRDVGASGPPGAIGLDALKSIVMMAAGADRYAGEMAAAATAAAPVREDADLDHRDARNWPDLARCDAIVIGTGAGGAFAGRALARAGHDVVMVEEGDRWTVERFRAAHPLERFAGLYRDAGATFALGSPPIALPVGRAVGGTTVINSGTCYRPPAHVIETWQGTHGLRLADADELADRLADVEETIGVAAVPSAIMGRNGELALTGAGNLGWQAEPLRRNAPGCRGACQCAIGCPNNAKAGVHLTSLPQACAAGARIVSGLRAEEILTQDGRAQGASLRRRDGSRLEIRSHVVVVAGGAIETPALLRRSGLGSHPRVGRGLSIHPAVGTIARFAEPVNAWQGVLQSAGIEELHRDHGVLIEATSTPPGMGSMAIPGVGAELVERVAEAERHATLGAMVADAPSGRIIGAKRPIVLYRLARRDRRRLVFAIDAMARVLLAAGAQQVELGGGAPAVRAMGEIPAAIDRIDPRRLHLAAFHPTGTVAAGSHPSRHPADAEGRLRGAEGVWIADASILPSCPGVNPQVSIMALAAAVGERASGAGSVH